MYFTIETELLTHYRTCLTGFTHRLRMQQKAGCFSVLMLANAMMYLPTSNSDGKRAKDTFILLLTFTINPLQESACAGLRVKPGPPKDTICCFLFCHTQRRHHFAPAVNEETSGLAVFRLIYRTFVALDIYCGSGGP